jgi:RNA polymerase sigma-70 factor (ECF subfamily)
MRVVRQNGQREVQLAQRMLSGDVAAFEAFVEIFRKRLFQYSYLMCGQRDDAEEVAQETLLSVFQNLRGLREPEHVRTWVFRIAKNACLMKRRKSIFAPHAEVSLDQIAGDEPPAQLSDGAALPDEQMFRLEMNEALTRAIQALPPSYRSVILLRDVEELTTEEAAQILDISNDLVKQRLHRARMAIRKLLLTELSPRPQSVAPSQMHPEKLDQLRAEFTKAISQLTAFRR